MKVPGRSAFSRWLEAERDTRRLGVREMADEISQRSSYGHVSVSMVSNWINGKSLPNRKSVKILADWSALPAEQIEAMLPAERRGHPAATMLPNEQSPTVAAFILAVLRRIGDTNPHDIPTLAARWEITLPERADGDPSDDLARAT